jgi:hypothetical protein
MVTNITKFYDLLFPYICKYVLRNATFKIKLYGQIHLDLEFDPKRRTLLG